MREKNLISTVVIAICIILGFAIGMNARNKVATENFQNGLVVGEGIENCKIYFELQGDEESLEKLENLEKELEDAKNLQEINEILKELEILLDQQI